MPTVWTEVEVDVDLDDFDDDDLIDEIESRGHMVVRKNGAFIDEDSADGLLKKIYELRIMNKPYERELELLIWRTVGRM